MSNMKVLLVLTTVLTFAFGAPPKVQPPIVGGRAIDIREVPYQVSLQAHGNHICGGVLISSDWVITAAHCIVGLSPGVVSFRGGSNYHASGGQVVSASRIISHPQYTPANTNNDIAVVSLLESFSLSSTINVVQLPRPGQDWADGEASQVTGWGALAEGGWSSPNLQAVNVPIVGLFQCRAFFWNNAITEQMLCAGYPEGGRDACQNDSGGPLTVNGVLAGIVSWGVGCARPNFPGVYAHVGVLRNFIAENTGI